MLWKPSEVIDVIGASLDCVAERAGLSQEEVYLWVQAVIPQDMWELLWDSLDTQVMRSKGGAVAWSVPMAASPRSEGRSPRNERAAGLTPRTPGRDGEAGPLPRRAGPPPQREPQQQQHELAGRDLASLAASRSLVGTSPADREAAASRAARTPPRDVSPAPGSGDLAMAAASRELVGRSVSSRVAAAAAERPAAGAPSRRQPPPANSEGAFLDPESDEEELRHAHYERRGAGGGHAAGSSSARGPAPESASRPEGRSAGPTADVRKGTLADYFRGGGRGAPPGNRSPSAGVIARRSSDSGTPRTQYQPQARSVSPAIRPVDSMAARSNASWAAEPPPPSRPRAALAADFDGSPDSLHECDPSEEESRMGTQAMSTWLELEGSPVLTPYQVADWLRVLQTPKVERETKKDLARRVLHFRLNGDDFAQALSGGRWPELGIKNEREAVLLLRYFKQRQQEATMAEAARKAATNKVGRPARKAEMIVA